MNAHQVDKIANRVRWGYLTAFLLLLCSYILTFYTNKQLLTESEMVRGTNQAINEFDNVLNAMKDAESALRGYVIMKDEEYLRDFYKNPRLVSESMQKLESLAADDDLKNAKLDTLKKLITAKFDVLSFGLRSFREKLEFSDSLRTAAYKGKALMDDIKVYLMKLKSEEEQKMLSRSGKITAFSDTIKFINVISIVVAILLTFYSLVVYNKENIARKEADKKATQFREELELRITDLNKINAELVELKSIEKFAVTGRIARTIAHEVRNPLTNINLATEHLKGEIPRNADTDMLLEMITRNGNRINQLISDLLNSTRESHLSFEKVEINKLIDDSIALAKDRFELKRIKVVKKYAPESPSIMADQIKIKIAFLNIIVNAIEAMQPDTGILQVKTEKKGNKCIITFADNGKGLDREELSRLFEPYFTTKEEGTGLGLTNTQNIILSHKANISAVSESGAGASFIITFKIAG